MWSEESECPIQYPTPKREESVVDTPFPNVSVPDPYRWMENPDSEETKKFVEEQNELCQSYIKGCSFREEILSQLIRLWDYPKCGVPRREGEVYYLLKNNGIQNQDVLYVQKDLESEPEVFLDPNLLSEDGTISLNNSAFSEDGSLFAYCLSTSGSDWVEIHFRNVTTGETYPEVLKKVKFTSLTWTHDNKGIFYSCYPMHTSGATGRNADALTNQKLYYHRIGTDQSQDILCVEFTEQPQWIMSSEISDCGRYLFLFVSKDCENSLVFYSDLKSLPEGEVTKNLAMKQIVFEFEYEFKYVTNTGPVCVFQTNRGAPNYCLIEIDLDVPPRIKKAILYKQNWKELDVVNTFSVNDLKTGEFKFQIPLPMGSVKSASGSKKHKKLFYKMSSMISPGDIYWVDLSQASSYDPHLYFETKIEGFDSSLYDVKQVFYNSEDGTRIPMFIGSKKKYTRNNITPCLLYGYGGFNRSITPSFSITNLFFIKHFGYAVIANIRGGGEYGKMWNNDGKLFKKQNCFTDFQYAAKYLIQKDYTCSKKLCIMGGSNGGLLVAACINQKPGLFAGAVAQCGYRGFLILMSVLVTLTFLLASVLPPVKLEMDVMEEHYTQCSAPSPILKNHSVPLLYIVTPTYTRREQIAELTRLGQTLLHISDMHWILSEDAHECSPSVAEILGHFKIPYTHLVSPMPSAFLHDRYKPRGVSNRHDDNTYDLRLFSQMRQTTKVSMFPVGLIGSTGFSSPIVKDGKVVGFSDDWFADRQYPIDMAGFALNVAFLRERGGGNMPYKPGHEEDRFLTSMKVELNDITCLAENCTQILVWHTKTVSEKAPKLRRLKNKDTSLSRLVDNLVNKNMGYIVRF
ncbi:PREP [Lepeophtheirus salmonis]|uniref:Multifunctional fusion protein n=1 Tax=Lepeophtheirus salmonis TaxID=72036 RepID=A0A7R8H8B3_LEPSM|nr:PREP [Lepeophtheirus salmonis]CAF2936851.1 PREP [Lepeophtheirus salmonis]